MAKHSTGHSLFLIGIGGAIIVVSVLGFFTIREYWSLQATAEESEVIADAADIQIVNYDTVKEIIEEPVVDEISIEEAAADAIDEALILVDIPIVDGIILGTLNGVITESTDDQLVVALTGKSLNGTKIGVDTTNIKTITDRVLESDGTTTVTELEVSVLKAGNTIVVELTEDITLPQETVTAAAVVRYR